MKEVCEKCGHELKTHYIQFCPMCYIPIAKVIEVYDLFKVLIALESRYEGIKDRLWDLFNDDYDYINNDSYIKKSLTYNPYEKDTEEYEQAEIDLQRMREFLWGKKEVHFWVSW